MPVFDAAAHNVPAAVLKKGEVWWFNGALMIGGCKKTFARRDAYARHLKREEKRRLKREEERRSRGEEERRSRDEEEWCVGDPYGPYQLGNAPEADEDC